MVSSEKWRGREPAWACHVWWQPSTHQHPTHQPRFWGLICSPENVGRLAAQMFAHSSQDWRAWWVLWPLTDIIWQTDLSDPSLRRVVSWVWVFPIFCVMRCHAIIPFIKFNVRYRCRFFLHKLCSKSSHYHQKMMRTSFKASAKKSLQRRSGSTKASGGAKICGHASW